MALLLQRGFRPLVNHHHHHHRLFSTINQSLVPPPFVDEVIKTLCDLRTPACVHSQLNDMRIKGWNPDSNTCKSILHGLQDYPGDRIQQLYNYMHDKGIEPDRSCAQSLLYKLCISGCYKTGLSAFRESASKDWFKSLTLVDTLNIKTLMNMHVWAGLCLDDNAREEIKEIMKLTDVHGPPTGFHINMLKIEGLCLIGETDKAKDLFQNEWKMMKPIRSHIYYHLISGYYREGKLEQVKALFSEMCEKGVQPDKLCYKTQIHFLCKDKDIGMALEVYNHAISKDILTRDELTGEILMESLIDNGNLEQVKRLYRFMVRKRVQLREYTLRMIFDYFYCNRDTKMALRVLKYSYKVGKCYVFEHLLRLCEILKFEEMVELIDYMEKKAYSVKIHTYIYWIINLCEKNNIEEAELVYETMRSGGRIPEPCAYKLLIRPFSGNAKVLRKIYQDVCENDIQANEYFYKDLVDALLHCEDYETVFRLAYNCLKNRQFSHVFLSDASTMKTLKNGLAIMSKNGVVKKDLKLIAEKGHERLHLLWSTIEIDEAIAMIDMLSSCDLQPNRPTDQQLMTIVSRDWEYRGCKET